ncbi:MAG: hypothetical protein RJA57_695 [Bacteroidota bacterium]
MRFDFFLRYHTQYGQTIYVGGDLEQLGAGDPSKALSLNYMNDEFWSVSLDIKRKQLPTGFRYYYFVRNADGSIRQEWGHDRVVLIPEQDTAEIRLIDTWNHPGAYENVFFSDAFRQVLLRKNRTRVKDSSDKHATHVFRVKAPLLKKNEVLCLLGSGERMQDWSTAKPLLLHRDGNDEGDWWTVALDLGRESLPLFYKYGIFHCGEKRFMQYEEGPNRVIQDAPARKSLTILHDGFAQLPNTSWKGAGVAIPVFSLRSRNSFGVGEFSDIRLLVDWAAACGLRLIQLLPVNDTTATHSWMDSYPYSAVSAFGLHPLYINLRHVAGAAFADQLTSLEEKQRELNRLPVVDYEEVTRLKIAVLRELYAFMGERCLASGKFKRFFNRNRHWLEPFAAFCHLRDEHGTPDFRKWPEHSVYDAGSIAQLCEPGSADHASIAFYYFLQYHLHQQLKDAVDHAHKKGVVLKGDIPIGISRNSCDAWVEPALYNMDWQAGAPPDDFTAVGQNWGFPTYNWKRMQADGFAWWKKRFCQMHEYFDAFRIDHILGFFRIWSIPDHAVQGILGRFVPCLPVHISEFSDHGIWFDYKRFCRPYITDEVLNERFGDQADTVRTQFLKRNDLGTWDLRPEFETQKQVADYFSEQDPTTQNDTLQLGLFDLISNVLLFEQEGSIGQEFHFRISMEKTASFRHLLPQVQEKLSELYVHYFYRRQDAFWKQEALQKLPSLKAATNMLVCGEDLGMVPDCVPDVMRDLGILSLEIQRMPKDPNRSFFHPQDAPYLSVITPSTHDMSTIRGWWEENRQRTQEFYNKEMGQWGDAPYYCEPWINRSIVLQHLHAPAMWSIFQLQDLLGMSDALRRENPQEERINDPANPRHYWQYRMHLDLEDLLAETAFNRELREQIEQSGRA